MSTRQSMMKDHVYPIVARGLRTLCALLSAQNCIVAPIIHKGNAPVSSPFKYTNLLDASAVMLPHCTDVTNCGEVLVGTHGSIILAGRLQSVINLNECGSEDDGLMIDTEWFHERGCDWVKVEASTGDLIMWDSRPVHNTRYGQYGRYTTTSIPPVIAVVPVHIFAWHLLNCCRNKIKKREPMPSSSIAGRREHQPKLHKGKPCPLDTVKFSSSVQEQSTQDYTARMAWDN
ncbi:hypothetical protein DFS33DRAFT_1273916 [Desarmillaria ectypa]|nr:hypothetical protein DFS33DRAFT_1273916 [Desarmillaria ectypa]